MLKNSINQTGNWKLLLLILLTGITIYARFHDTFLQFGEKKMVEVWGDGLKTYTNTIYHVRYDSTYSYFNGMNYPFGEHIMAATELPGLAILVKFIDAHISQLSDAQIIDSVHLTLMLSMLLCSLFIYLIFNQLGIPWWFSIPMAIAITFMGPQTMRMKGHFGLGVLFVLPMIFYLLLQFEQKKKWKWSVWMALAVFISAQFHFYFFGIVAATILIYLSVSCVFNIFRTYQPQKLKIVSKYILHFAIMVGIPLLFFYFWMIFNDPVTDRSPKPFGFLHYRANWEGIFLMRELPFYDWINDHLIKIRPTQFEGRIYIGMVATAFCLWVFLKWSFQKFKKGLFPFYINQQPYLYSLFFAGFLLVLFACAFPFSITGLEFLVDYTGPLQQFRSVGRFGWVFYFAINIIAVIVLYQTLSSWKNQKWATALSLLIFVVFAYEAFQVSFLKKYTLQEVPYFNDDQPFNEIEGIDFSRYQAILPLPYFNVGSNNFEKSANGFATQRSFVMSAQTGLPITTAMMTRTSRNQTYKQWQLISKPFQRPVIFDEYTSEKPILLIWYKKMKPVDVANYDHLRKGAKLIFEKKSVALYELPLSIFEERIEQTKTEILEEISTDSLHQVGTFLSTDSTENFVYQDFELRKVEKPFSGTGAFEGIANQNNILFERSFPNQTKDAPYTISFWTFLNQDRFGVAIFLEIEEIDQNGKTIQELKKYLGKEAKVFNTNGWVLSEFTFKPKSAESSVRLNVRWNKIEAETIWVDDFLIRPSKVDIYKKGNNRIWKNNLGFQMRE
jgi:hypothetical protein